MLIAQAAPTVTQTVTRTVTETVPSIPSGSDGGAPWWVVVGVAAITALATLGAAIIPARATSQRNERERRDRERERVREVLATMLGEVHDVTRANSGLTTSASLPDSREARTAYWRELQSCVAEQQRTTMTWARLAVLVGDAPIMASVHAFQDACTDFLDVATAMNALDDDFRACLVQAAERVTKSAADLMGKIEDLTRVDLPELAGPRSGS